MTAARQKQIRQVFISITAFLLLSALTASSAIAKSSQITLMRDDRQVVGNGDAAREDALDRMKALGVDRVQIMVGWKGVQPSCSSYSWGSYDAAVAGIQARGMDVMMNPAGPVPKCGSTNKKSKYRAQMPNVKRFKKFARAAASHFRSVDVWGVYNEPNQGGWIVPQSKFSPTLGRMVRLSPHLYRKLYVGAASQIRSVNPGAEVLVGDTAPLGSKDMTATRPTRPTEFWREFFCLDSSYKPFTGPARKARGCPNPFPRIKTQGIAHHPYTRGGAQSPNAKGSKGDLPLAKTKALASIFRRAAARGRVSANLPIYFTEYGLQTRPPDFHLAVSLSNQARYINEAEYIGYKNGRVSSYSQYEMVDDPIQTQFPKSSPKRYGGFQTGLRFEDGREKPSYDAFRLPLVVVKKGSDRVLVWGGVRPKVGSTTVQIEAGSGGTFENVGSPISLASGERYFQKEIDLSGASGKSWRLTWKAPDGTTHHSRTAKANSK